MKVLKYGAPSWPVRSESDHASGVRIRHMGWANDQSEGPNEAKDVLQVPKSLGQTRVTPPSLL